VQRVTNILTFKGCPTIQFYDKKVTKGKHLRPLNQKKEILLLPGVIVGQPV
jgi:hypothetical protein